MTIETEDHFFTAVVAVPKTREYVIRELRSMAAAERGYTRFNYISPWIKNVWHAAADLLENEDVTGKDVRCSGG